MQLSQHTPNFGIAQMIGVNKVAAFLSSPYSIYGLKDSNQQFKGCLRHGIFEINVYIIDYILYRFMTTIAVKESTVEKLKRLMKARHAESLDQTINSLIETAENMPSSMFGVDKGKRIHLTRQEHEEFQR